MEEPEEEDTKKRTRISKHQNKKSRKRAKAIDHLQNKLEKQHQYSKQLLREGQLRAHREIAELRADGFIDKLMRFKREEMSRVDTSELSELTRTVTSSLL